MTNEEYIDIIDLLDFFYGDNLIATAELRKEKSKELQEEDLNNFKRKLDCLRQLVEIKSRLSRVESSETRNEPLKFEDLKECLWVWDNFLQEYMYINIIYNNQSIVVGRVRIKEPYTLIFEENRFYLREVKEDDMG